MSFAESFLPGFEQEMGSTRQILELVPQELLNWKAHQSLNSIGWVASHLVDTMSWTEVIVTQPSFDIAPPGQPPHETELIDSAAELVPMFDRHFESAKGFVSGAAESSFDEPWTLLQRGEALFTAPRGSVVKNFLLNHVIHHRAFLVAYLRMNDVVCPGLYG